MYNIGACYEEGNGGVTKDLNNAREWYTKAAAQGHAGAQTELDSLNASNN
jgi:TPR repeat protein